MNCFINSGVIFVPPLPDALAMARKPKKIIIRAAVIKR